MRTTLLCIILLIPISLNSQDIRIKNVSRVRPEDKGSYLLSGVVPGSRSLLVAGEGYKGLSILDTRSGKVSVISNDEGAGYEPAVTADGKKVLFRSDSYSDNRKYSSIQSYDIESGVSHLLVDKERDVLPPAVSDNAVLLKSEKDKRIETYGTSLTKGTGGEKFVVIEDMMPVLYRGDERKPLMPNGDGFYIWASLSPDRSLILYNYQGRNTYICDLEGKVLFDLGKINAPRWFNDQIIIGMDDQDDGYRITSSELVYYSLSKQRRKVLTSTPDRSEMFPFAFGNKKIAFTTDNGEIYVMKIRIR